MRKEQKIKKDRHTLAKYMKKLESMRAEIIRQTEVFSLTGRRNRVTAIGESVLKLLEDFNKQQAELKLRGHKMLDGTLFWIVEEQRVKDTDGKKGFRYRFAYFVKTDEPKYTREEIQQEMEETYQKIKAETEEMYGEPVTDEEYGVTQGEGRR